MKFCFVMKKTALIGGFFETVKTFGEAMQTGYELVRNAIAFTGPERVPVNFDSNRSPEIETKYGDDLIWVFVGGDPDFVPPQPGNG